MKLTTAARVVVQREDDVALGGGHAGGARGRRDVPGQLHQVDVGELRAHHLGAAVGGRVVHREDLDRMVLPACGVQCAPKRVAALVVQDRDRDEHPQLGT
jgi:hypothetical protein